MPSSLAGGDPFSHPSGSSVARPAWVTGRSAAGRLPSARSARPPPGRPGARKHSVPNRVHSVVMTCGSRDLWAARPTWRRLLAWSNHHKITLGHCRRGGLGAGGDPPCPFSSVGSGVQTPLRVHDRSPRNPSACLTRRRARRRRAHPPPLRATRLWPVCRPAPWSR